MLTDTLRQFLQPKYGQWLFARHVHASSHSTSWDVGVLVASQAITSLPFDSGGRSVDKCFRLSQPTLLLAHYRLVKLIN